MYAATVIGRVGGLAIALGIGVAIANGCASAMADSSGLEFPFIRLAWHLGIIEIICARTEFPTCNGCRRKFADRPGSDCGQRRRRPGAADGLGCGASRGVHGERQLDAVGTKLTGGAQMQVAWANQHTLAAITSSV